MRAFLVPQVAKLVRKARLPEAALCRTAREVLAGTLGAGEADLGDGLFKKRVARTGGGYRVIVAYRSTGTQRVQFAYVFARDAASTLPQQLPQQGHEALAKVVQAFLAADDGQVAALLASGDVTEVECNGNQQT